MDDFEKTILARFVEKTIRQRRYYLRLIRKWRQEQELVTEEASHAYLEGKIDTISHCARDMEFALSQVQKSVPEEYWNQIERLAQDNEQAVLKRIHEKINQPTTHD